MFQSFDWRYLGYNLKTNQSQYETTFVDDDFIETVVVSFISTINDGSSLAAVLIDIYSQRNLNVAGNLVLLMQYIENKWPWIDIKWQIERYQKEVPEYQKYHDQVMDYLIFM